MRNRLTLGIVCHGSRGGSVRVAVDLTDALARRGHRVHLFSPRRPFDSWRPPKGVTLHTLEGRCVFRGRADYLHTDWNAAEGEAFTDLLAIVATSAAIDIVHVHYALPFAELAAAAADRMGSQAPALVATLHGTDVTCHAAMPAYSRRLTAALNRMDTVTTVSRNHAALARELLPLAPPPVVIPNFVDPVRFHPRPPRPRPAGRVLHLSNFRRVKNTMAIPEVFARIRKERPAELWLGGTGEDLPAVEARLKELGLNGDVRVLGWRDDVADLMAVTDLVLLTSHHESFSLTALEAMACGRPVVAPRVGGLTELIEDGVSGLLYPPGDMDAAARLAGRVLDDEAEGIRIAAAAVRRASEFALRPVVDRYERLYDSISSVRAVSRLAIEA